MFDPTNRAQLPSTKQYVQLIVPTCTICSAVVAASGARYIGSEKALSTTTAIITQMSIATLHYNAGRVVISHQTIFIDRKQIRALIAILSAGCCLFK